MAVRNPRGARLNLRRTGEMRPWFDSSLLPDAIPVVGVHALLGPTHTDTSPDAPTRGSLIYGNLTPAWDELVIGGIAGSVVTRDAADVLWSTYALAGTVGQTYTFPAVSGNVALGAGTLTAATLNDVTVAAHTHAITETADGDTIPSTLLYTDANGTLRVRRFGVGIAALAVDGTIALPANGYIGRAANDLRIVFDSANGFIEAVLGDAAGADEFQIQDSAGAEVFSVDSDGEIDTVLTQGIVMSSAGGVLSVTAGTPVLGGGSGASPRVAFWADANTLTGDAGLTVDAANDFYLVANAGGVGNSAATARLGFDSSGVTDYAYFSSCNVGIGTITPAVMLHVSTNSTGEAARFQGNNNALHSLGLYVNAGLVGEIEWDNGITIGVVNSMRFRNGGGEFHFRRGATTDVIFNASGDVIIGAAAASAQLHIDQASATGAQPVLYLDQGDVSEQHIVLSMNGADQDFPNIIQLAVTGSPAQWWDESENSFGFKNVSGLLLEDDDWLGISGTDLRLEFDSSDGDIMAILGDAAGSDEFQVVDSGSAVVAFTDSDGSGYYAAGLGVGVTTKATGGDIYLTGQMGRSTDTNTYIDFPAADQISLVAGAMNIVYGTYTSASYRDVKFITDANQGSMHWIGEGINSVTVLAAGTVTNALLVSSLVVDSGGGIEGGNYTVAVGATQDIYDDGVDVCELEVTAGGAVTLIRTAGAATFTVNLALRWA